MSVKEGGDKQTEGLVDRKHSLDDVHGSSGGTGLLSDVSTAAVEHTVDASNGDLGALNLDLVDGLDKLGLGRQLQGLGEKYRGMTNDAAVQTATGRGDDLTASTVNGIRVQGDIIEVEADTADVLVADGSLLGGPLESSNNRVLDLGQVLRKVSTEETRERQKD